MATFLNTLLRGYGYNSRPGYGSHGIFHAHHGARVGVPPDVPEDKTRRRKDEKKRHRHHHHHHHHHRRGDEESSACDDADVYPEDDAFEYKGNVTPSSPYEVPHPSPTGKTRGLFIGISYAGTPSELCGRGNDVALMIDTLKTLQFPLQEAAILVDDPSFAGASGLPTRDNIIQHMMWLVKDTRPGDVLFFHYSGHGSNLEEGGAETQMLVPMDFQSEGVIVDDDIFELMVRNLPEGVRMTAVMDCCHSGSLMDLPFTFVPDPRQAQLAAGNFRMTAERSFGMRQSRGDVVLFSGCEDGQVSADSSNAAAQFGNRYGSGGACTNAMCMMLLQTQGLTIAELLFGMQRILREKRYNQNPQLSTLRPIDFNQPFTLSGPLLSEPTDNSSSRRNSATRRQSLEMAT